MYSLSSKIGTWSNRKPTPHFVKVVVRHFMLKYPNILKIFNPPDLAICCSVFSGGHQDLVSNSTSPSSLSLGGILTNENTSLEATDQ